MRIKVSNLQIWYFIPGLYGGSYLIFSDFGHLGPKNSWPVFGFPGFNLWKIGERRFSISNWNQNRQFSRIRLFKWRPIWYRLIMPECYGLHMNRSRDRTTTGLGLFCITNFSHKRFLWIFCHEIEIDDSIFPKVGKIVFAIESRLLVDSTFSGKLHYWNSSATFSSVQT